MTLSEFLKLKICKYLHFFQNALPTTNIFSAILKLHNFKTNISVKKTTPYLEIHNFFSSTKYI